MKIPAQPPILFTDLERFTARSWKLVASVLAILATTESAIAAGHDGNWRVLFVTQAGSCDQTYSFPVTISGGRISSDGPATITGSVGRGGGVIARVSAGSSVANGSGRLKANYGAGRWSGRGASGVCSGRWQATRG